VLTVAAFACAALIVALNAFLVARSAVHLQATMPVLSALLGVALVVACGFMLRIAFVPLRDNARPVLKQTEDVEWNR